MLKTLSWFGLLLAFVFASACTVTKIVEDDDDSAASGGMGGAGGSSAPVGGGGSEPVNDDCAQLGLTQRAWVEAEESTALYATASNVVLPTTEGDYDLAANWTGCDAILFIQDVPRQNTSYAWPIPLWDRDVDTLLSRAPKNTRLFFLSTENDQPTIDAAIGGLKTQIDQALALMTVEDAAWWTTRIHYVTAKAQTLPGWLGPLFYSPGWGIGIDRAQRIRYIGSYADSMRFDSGAEWFAPNLSMAANEPIYYNFEADRDAALEAQDATVITVFPGGPDSLGAATDVAFPDASTMAGFDSMELDMYMGCIGNGEFGDCPPWDYMAYVYLCDNPADPDDCGTEIGRWITTYHREGRWVHDVSGLLPLFADGGTFRFKFQSQNSYELKFDIRLFNSAKAAKPTETTYLFDSFGVGFNETYNEGFEPMDLPIPADAKKVEIGVVISGHGQNAVGNCAEFCVTDHHFIVNGTDNEIKLSDAGKSNGCMDQVNQGTVPNQYGTWWYGRSGWCPGKDVPMQMLDITDQVTLGATNTFDYEGYRNGQPYTASATIRMRSWLVVSK